MLLRAWAAIMQSSLIALDVVGSESSEPRGSRPHRSDGTRWDPQVGVERVRLLLWWVDSFCAGLWTHFTNARDLILFSKDLFRNVAALIFVPVSLSLYYSSNRVHF